MINILLLSIEDPRGRRTAENIWERYQRHLLKTVTSILKEPHDREDAVMETMRCVVQSIGKFTELDEDAILGLLTVYAKHAAFKIYNKNKGIAKNTADFGEDIEFADSAPYVEDTVVVSSEYERAARCLNELPEIYSHVFLLRHYYGWSVKEIVKELDLPEATVKKRLYRAKQLLRKRMGVKDE